MIPARAGIPPTRPDAIPPIGSPRVRLVAAAALVVVAIGALLLRVPSIAQPPGIDQSLWASAVFGMEHGQRLYRDVWEQRPPGIYWIYLAGFRAFGWSPATIAVLDILAAIAMTALLYVIARRLSNPLTAALASAMYAALTMPAWLYGHGGFLERAVCETFIVVCVGAAAWAADRCRARPTLVAGGAIGFFAGAAVVLKPNAGLYFPALLLWLALYTPASARRKLLPAAAAAVLASAIIPAAAVGWLWMHGTLEDARVAVIDFNRYYVGQGWSASTYVLDFSRAIWLRTKTDPLWLVGMVGTLTALTRLAGRRHLPPLAGLALVWGAAAALVIVVNGARLFNSYFINALPPLTLMGAWLLSPRPAPAASSEGTGDRQFRLAAAAMAGVLMTGLLVQRNYAARVANWVGADVAVLRGAMDRQTYLERFGGYANGRGYSARAHEELAEYIGARTSPGERIFLFGINGAGIYFASERLTAHRFLRVNFFVDTGFPHPAFSLESVVADLRAAPPRYLIFERLHSTSAMARAADALPGDARLANLLEGYTFEQQIEDFTILRRR